MLVHAMPSSRWSRMRQNSLDNFDSFSSFRGVSSDFDVSNINSPSNTTIFHTNRARSSNAEALGERVPFNAKI